MLCKAWNPSTFLVFDLFVCPRPIYFSIQTFKRLLRSSSAERFEFTSPHAVCWLPSTPTSTPTPNPPTTIPSALHPWTVRNTSTAYLQLSLYVPPSDLAPLHLCYRIFGTNPRLRNGYSVQSVPRSTRTQTQPNEHDVYYYAKAGRR